jgi:pyrroline-5-carboxylate reductase
MRIAFIGGGNMATALIGGLLRDGMAPASLHVVEVDPERLAALRQKFGLDGSSIPDDSLRGTDATVFAVKPQQMRQACTQCRPWLDGGFALTIAAGIPAASVAAWSGRPQVVRAMPNTPALIGAGITGMSAGAELASSARGLAERIMSAAGEVVWFDDESMLDAVTAVSGSGPAYVFFFIEALQAAGQAMGMTADQARRLSIATFRGAAQLAYQSDQPVQALREQVTSKGGTTAAALEKMQTLGLHEQIVAAVWAALERSRELASTYGDTTPTPGTR